MPSFAQDIRYSLRRLRRSPGFASLAVLTLALGIGATTVVYSVIQAVLLNSLPFPRADRLYVLSESQKGEDFSVAWPNFEDWRQQSRSFEAMAGYTLAHFQYFDGTHTTLLRGARVSAAFFPILQVRPLVGRTFTDAEDRHGGPSVLVLSYECWQNQLHGSTTAIGSALNLSDQAYTIIGIMPPDFRFFYGHAADFYLPLGPQASEPGFNSRTAHGSIRVLARLRPGVSEAAARTEMEGIAARLAAQYPATNAGHSVLMERLSDRYFHDVRPALWLLFCAVVLVLLVACANVSNLLLAQGAGRAREYAIRTAIGAGRYRLFQQSLADGLCLAAIGGGCGVLLAWAALPMLLRLAPQDMPRLADTAIQTPVLLFALGVAVIVAAACSILPAASSMRIGPELALKASTSLAARGKDRVRSCVLVAGVAVTVVLTAGTGLMLRSLRQALSTDPGFQPDHLLSLDVVLSSPEYKNHDAAGAFFTEAADKVKAVPGVVAAGTVFCPPMAGDCLDNFYSIPGRIDADAPQLPISLFNIADAGYFRAAGIRLLQGRGFSSIDTAGSPHVAVVNQTFSKKWWPEGGAVGHSIRYGGRGEPGYSAEIVGVVGDVRQFGLDAPSEPEVFFPDTQQPRDTMVLLVRTAPNPAALAAATEGAIHDVDKEVPVRIHPMTAVIADTLRQRKFLTTLLSLFAGLTLFLAALGVFGVAAYSVSSRTTEIGLRVALGAEPDRLKRWISVHTLRLVALGCVIGMVGCCYLLRLMSSVLFEVSPLDPLVLGGSCLLLIAVSFAAAWLPARRAAAIDPIQALRAE